MDYFTLETKYGRYENCFFRTNAYRDGSIAIKASQVVDGFSEPILFVTVNLGHPLPENCIAVKDYSENEGVLDCLQELGLITEVVCRERSGYVIIPVCRYDPEILARYCKD